MVPRALAPVRAMRSRTCAHVGVKTSQCLSVCERILVFDSLFDMGKRKRRVRFYS